MSVKDGTLGGAGTSVLPGSLGHEAERSVGSDSSRPLGAYDGGCAGTWKGVNLWRVQKTDIAGAGGSSEKPLGWAWPATALILSLSSDPECTCCHPGIPLWFTSYS